MNSILFRIQVSPQDLTSLTRRPVPRGPFQVSKALDPWFEHVFDRYGFLVVIVVLRSVFWFAIFVIPVNFCDGA